MEEMQNIVTVPFVESERRRRLYRTIQVIQLFDTIFRYAQNHSGGTGWEINLIANPVTENSFFSKLKLLSDRLHKVIYMMIKKLFFLLFFLSPLSLFARVNIRGNGVENDATFAVPMAHLKREAQKDFYYLGAGQVGAKEYAISCYIPDIVEKKCISMAPRTIRLNRVENQLSEIHNARIRFLAPFTSGRCAVVVDHKPRSVFVIDDISGLLVMSLDTIADGNGKSSGDIKNILNPSSVLLPETFFVAINGSDQKEFGEGESGIAVLTIASKEVKDESDESKTIKVRFIQQIDATETSDKETIHAAPLQCKTPAVYINTPLEKMGRIIDMHWSEHLRTLYIAYDAVGGEKATDGARSIALGRFKNNVLHIMPLVSDSVFVSNANHEIIGAVGAAVSVTAHKVRTLHTSTLLDYLIILGGNGSPEETQRTIYALPLVNRLEQNGSFKSKETDFGLQGTLADVHASPILQYAPSNTKPSTVLFAGRHFEKEAKNPEDIFTKNDPAACVGQGPVPGSVSSIQTVGEAIYAIASATDNEHAGIYSSQPIFNEYGVIVGWTPWSLVWGSSDRFSLAEYNLTLGTFIIGKKGPDQGSDTFYHTTWGTGNSTGLGDLVALCNEFFESKKGGIQTAAYFKPGYLGIKDIGIFLAAGLDSLLLVQTGTMQNGSLRAHNQGYRAHHMVFATSEVNNVIPCTMQSLLFSAGALEKIGPIQTAEWGATPFQAWLFVGGINGIAVLCGDQGQGWDPRSGLTNGFGGILQGFSFKQIGSSKFVKKLVCDNGFLYVLTDSSLERIDLQQSNFARDQLLKVTLATSAQTPGDVSEFIPATFLDVIISEKLAVLATSTGLWKSETDISGSSHDVFWQKVATPSLPFFTPIKLYAVTTTGFEQDLARGLGGQLYIMHGDSGQDKAVISRYFVKDMNVRLVQDFMAKNCIGYFGSCGSYRSVFALDGAHLITGRDRTVHGEPSGVFGFHRSSLILPLDIATGNKVNAIVRNGASGTLMFAGDFGLRVNE